MSRKKPDAEPLNTLEPQLATLVNDVPTGGDWLYEIQFDGYRRAQSPLIALTTTARRRLGDRTAERPGCPEPQALVSARGQVR